MRPTAYVFLSSLFALVIISLVAANDPTQKDAKTDDNIKWDDGGYGGGWGGPGGGYGGGWGGPSGDYGGGWGGGNRWGGGWRGNCFWGCCGRSHWGGGCRCCYNAQEALAYMQSAEAKP